MKIESLFVLLATKQEEGREVLVKIASELYLREPAMFASMLDKATVPEWWYAVFAMQYDLHNRIGVIRYFREQTGADLKDAKFTLDYVFGVTTSDPGNPSSNLSTQEVLDKLTPKFREMAVAMNAAYHKRG